MSRIEAVVFDMDGVLVDTEVLWDEVREQLAAETGGTWSDHAQHDMMGMSSQQWPVYMSEQVGVPMTPEEINDEVVERIGTRLREQLPLMPGAVDAVHALCERWPLAVASTSNKPLIELVLKLAGIANCFKDTVSSEEVGPGKPEPDVYLEAARRLQTQPSHCAAIEDSGNGMRAALAAGMHVIAVPNRDYPPPTEVLAQADIELPSIAALTAATIEGLAAT